MQDDDAFFEFLKSMGYRVPRRLPDGEVIALMPFLFTWGVMLGLDETGYKRRFCYKNVNDALKVVANWDGTGDPPGPWIVEKGNGPDRQGPGSTLWTQVPKGSVVLEGEITSTKGTVYTVGDKIKTEGKWFKP